MLSKAGDHVPVIASLDVVGKAANVPPEQIGDTAVKVGVILELTIIFPVTTSPEQVPPINGML